MVTHGKRCILYCDPAHARELKQNFAKDYRLWPAFWKSLMWKRNETHFELIPRVGIRRSEERERERERISFDTGRNFLAIRTTSSELPQKFPNGVLGNPSMCESSRQSQIFALYFENYMQYPNIQKRILPTQGCSVSKFSMLTFSVCCFWGCYSG